MKKKMDFFVQMKRLCLSAENNIILPFYKILITLSNKAKEEKRRNKLLKPRENPRRTYM